MYDFLKRDSGDNKRFLRFKLSSDFLSKYKDQKINWGPLGKITYIRTYSRWVEDDGDRYKEDWWQTICRVVEGVFTIQKQHCYNNRIPWNNQKSQVSAKKMYDLMFNFKFLPPGRGLWAMGSEYVYKRGGACLNNCAFVTTKHMDIDPITPFLFLMDMSMLGVGVGFDTLGAKLGIKIHEPIATHKEPFVIPDSREGWVDALKLLLEAFLFSDRYLCDYDVSEIRLEGALIKGFGGTASGPEPLVDMLNTIKGILLEAASFGCDLNSIIITDIMNMIGKCVVSGNVRRSSEIAIGEIEDSEFMSMKDYNAHPFENSKKGWRWASNNSTKGEIGMNYKKIADYNISGIDTGIIWLDNMRKYGRLIDPPNWADKAVDGCNPCSEQSLEGSPRLVLAFDPDNMYAGGGELCCVSCDTKINTKAGVYNIIDKVGKEVEIWNGDEWSKVTPFIAGNNKDLFRVHISDGSYLDCTDDHKWSVRGNGKKVFRQVETKDLRIGDTSIPFEIDSKFEGTFVPNAYEYGLFSGDGYLDRGIPMISVYGKKIKLKELDVKGFWRKEQILEQYKDPVNRLNLKDVIEYDKSVYLNDKSYGLPDWVFEMDKESILEFIAGLIDTDGNCNSQINTDNYRIFGNEEKIRDLQILSRRIGINHASVQKIGEKGEETNYGIRNYDLYQLYIPSFECFEIPTKIKIAEKIGSRYKTNNAYPDGKKIDTARKQKIVRIEKLEGKHTTCCFNEPINHMGVFGNVLTYQCLVETFPSLHDSYDEYQDTLKYAYMYAKTVTLIPTHWEGTNSIMLRNRRIGTSQSGITQAFVKHGRDNMLNWCDNGYQYIRHMDDIYSDWLCVPRSIKVTSVKPSGSVSLLPGVSPGVHYDWAEYYIRRIRIGRSDEVLINILRSAGYRMDYVEADRTYAVQFPVHVKNFSQSEGDVSMWQQVTNVADYQRYWADNQVSCTIKYREHEKKDLAAMFEAFERQLKSISVLPYYNPESSENTDQEKEMMRFAPYETIDEEHYNKMVLELSEPDYSTYLKDSVSEKFCDGAACELS